VRLSRRDQPKSAPVSGTFARMVALRARTPKRSNGMAFFEDMFKGGNILTGLAIGVGLAVVGPVLRPVLRPVAKSLFKAGISAYEQGRLALAEINEQASDVMAEARAELGQEGGAAGEHTRAEAAQESRSSRRQQHAGA
jgi:hypothetical protein